MWLIESPFTIWEIVLLGLAFSLRKHHRYYSSLVLVCVFSALFTLFWALGLIFQSITFIKLTWIGALWPTALYFLMREIFQLPSSRRLKIAMWTLAVVNFLGGISPYCILAVNSYEPTFTATVGPIEPWMRVLLIVQILMIFWTALRELFNVEKKITGRDSFVLAGFVAYGVGVLFSCGLLPLFEEYRYLESTSFYSVVWVTFSVWAVFKELQQRNEALSELDQMKKNFISHVTHEFKTPIYTIESAMDILSDDAKKAKWDQSKALDYFSRITVNTNRLNNFVNQLLDLAAIQHSKITLRKERVDVETLIRDTVNAMQPLLDQAKCTVRMNLQPIPVECDSEKIKQVLTNLLSNAIKAAPEKAILVSLARDQAKVLVSVLDEGIGIAEDQLPQVFSSFYKVEMKSTTRKSSGLGLAIAKGWIEAHGGKIWAESRGEGKGATFYFTLPV